MNRYTFLRWTAVLTAIVLVLSILLPASAPQPAQALEKTDLKRALLGTVRLAVAVEAQKDTYSTGSGTVISADGYILTNFHVLGDKTTGKLYNKNGVAMVGVNPADLKSLPTWLYQATLVKGDRTLDLAVLKISATFKGGALPASLGLTPVPIGDSDTVDIGDDVHVVGFPGIGGDSVTYTSGTVAGFLDENADKVIDWIKTDAEINRGNSGGLAVNSAGQMIGVPTAGTSDPSAAGKISLIRPINRAMPLIKAAVVQGSGSVTPPGTPTPASGPRVTSLLFSDSVDASNRPGKTATAFAAGTQRVYAVFSYAGFRNGGAFEGVWYRDGARDVVTSLDWDAGASGSYWISISNPKGIIEGAYELVLSFEGTQVYRARMTVGGKVPVASSTTGTFGTPVFAEGVTADNNPVSPHRKNEPFASGANAIYAFTDFADMEDDTAWEYVWYIDDEEVVRDGGAWDLGESGNLWVSVSYKKGLPDGQYRIELYIDDALVAHNQTTVGGGGAPFQDDGVQMGGRIIDADTRRPIPGAIFVVLQPGVDAEEFLQGGSEDDIYSGGEADSKGMFVVEDLLQRGETYGLAVVAKGYQPVFMKAYTVALDAESPIEFEVQLRRSR